MDDPAHARGAALNGGQVLVTSHGLPSELAQSDLPTDPHMLQLLKNHYKSEPSLFILEADGIRFIMPRKVTCHHSTVLEYELLESEFGSEAVSPILPTFHLDWVAATPMPIVEWFVKIIYRLDPKCYEVEHIGDLIGSSEYQIERLIDLGYLNGLADRLKCDLILSSMPLALDKILHQLRVPKDTKDDLRGVVEQFRDAHIMWSHDAAARHKMLDALCRLVDVHRATDPYIWATTSNFRETVINHWRNMQGGSGTVPVQPVQPVQPIQHSTAASEGMEDNSEDTSQGS